MCCVPQLGQLDQWYLVIPGFCLFGLFWSICHVVLLITMWGFHAKLSECQRAWRSQRSQPAQRAQRSLSQVMASRGIRHFCLISERLVLFSVLSSVILGAVSWQVGEQPVEQNCCYLLFVFIQTPLVAKPSHQGSPEVDQ